jgi:hypothetical protein
MSSGGAGFYQRIVLGERLRKATWSWFRAGQVRPGDLFMWGREPTAEPLALPSGSSGKPITIRCAGRQHRAGNIGTITVNGSSWVVIDGTFGGAISFRTTNDIIAQGCST